MTILYIYMLPYQIVEQIWNNLDIITKLRVTKTNFQNHHYILKTNNLIKNYDSYVRCMIRENCDWIFKFILEENYNIWTNQRKIVYKNKIFISYIDYIFNIIHEFNSSKCKTVFLDFVNVSRYTKNKPKKKNIKSIRWTN